MYLSIVFCLEFRYLGNLQNQKQSSSDTFGATVGYTVPSLHCKIYLLLYLSKENTPTFISNALHISYEKVTSAVFMLTPVYEADSYPTHTVILLSILQKFWIYKC